MTFIDGIGVGMLMYWVTQWPIWSKLWLKLNKKLDEWAGFP
jgi:hypothetical protein